MTLHPGRLLPLNGRYRLTVRGTGTKGIADKSETLLDGESTGHPGSNYVTTISRSNFVFTTYAVIKAKSSKGLHSSQVTHVKAHAVDHHQSRRASSHLRYLKDRMPRG